MRPKFVSREAETLWRAYFLRVATVLRPLPPAEAEDLRSELESHVLEIVEEADAPTTDHFHQAFERLGDPETFLAPLVTDRLLELATRDLRPQGIAHALWHAATSQARSAALAILFGFGYVIALLFGTLAALKPFFPLSVGLFRGPGGEIVLGGLPESSEYALYEDLLGLWLTPLGLVVAIGLYVGLGKLLRYLRPAQSSHRFADGAYVVKEDK